MLWHEKKTVEYFLKKTIISEIFYFSVSLDAFYSPWETNFVIVKFNWNMYMKLTI